MANRYWRGGTGTWNTTSTTNWSATDGGVGGASVPTTADAVFITSLSGSPTITLTGALNCQSITTTGATCTLTSTGTLNCAGNFTLSTTTTWSGSGTITISATSTITTNTRVLNCSFIFNGSAATFTLIGSTTIGAGSSNTVNLTQGTLNLNNNTLLCNSFVSTSAFTRTLGFSTSGILNIRSSAIGNSLNITSSLFSYTGTSNISITTTGIGLTTSITTSGLTEAQAMNVSIGGNLTASDISGAVYKNLTISSGTLANGIRTIYGNFTISGAPTLTSGTNTTTFGATTGTQTINTGGITLDFPLIFGNASGTPTFTFASALTQGSTRSFTFNRGTIQFLFSTTNVVGSFITSGVVTKFLTSTLSGTRATISQASGTVNATYLSVKDSAATGGAVFNAFTTSNNIDAGNNTGWIFASVSSSTFFQLFP